MGGQGRGEYSGTEKSRVGYGKREDMGGGGKGGRMEWCGAGYGRVKGSWVG